MTAAKAGALAVLLVGGVAGLAIFGLRDPPKVTAKPPSMPVPQPRQTIEQSFPCRIVPRESVWASTAITGPVEAVYVDVGQTVADGQVLARVHSEGTAPVVANSEEEAARALAGESKARLTVARNEAKRLQAEVLRARSTVARVEPVFRKQQLLNQAGATQRLVFEKSRDEYQHAAAELAVAEEASRQADNAVSRMQDQQQQAIHLIREKSRAAIAATVGVATAEIHAPAAGLVVERRIAPGESVTAQNRAELFRIATQPELLRAEFDPGIHLQSGEAISIHAGDTQIRATVNDANAADFESRIGTVRPGVPCQARVRIK